MPGQEHDFSHLDRAGRATAGLARSPRHGVMLAIGAGIVLAWLILAAMAIRGAESRLAGGVPGDALIKDLPRLPLPDFLDHFFALCVTPTPLAPTCTSSHSPARSGAR